MDEKTEYLDKMVVRAEGVIHEVLARYEVELPKGDQLEEMKIWLAGTTFGRHPFNLNEVGARFHQKSQRIIDALEEALAVITEMDDVFEQTGIKLVENWFRDEPELYELTVEGLRRMLESARERYVPPVEPKQARPSTWKGKCTLFLADALLDLGESSIWRIANIVADLMLEIGAEQGEREKVVRATYDRLKRKHTEAMRKLDKCR